MNDELRKLLENPTLDLLEAIAAAQLVRAGVRLGADFEVTPPRLNPGSRYSQEFLARLTA